MTRDPQFCPQTVHHVLPADPEQPLEWFEFYCMLPLDAYFISRKSHLDYRGKPMPPFMLKQKVKDFIDSQEHLVLSGQKYDTCKDRAKEGVWVIRME